MQKGRIIGRGGSIHDTNRAMITTKPLEQAAERRLRHRSFHEYGGSVRMLSSDGLSAARLTFPQWEALIDDFAAAMRPVNKALRWGYNLTLPVMILTIAFMPNPRSIPLVGALHGRISLIVPLLMIIWWPLLMLLGHALLVRRLNRRFDERLATFPRVSMPPGRPVTAETIEIVAMMLFGPVIGMLFGSMFPHVFDGTSFIGARFVLFAALGLLLAILLAMPRIRSIMRAREERPIEIGPAGTWGSPHPSAPKARIRDAKSVYPPHTSP
jgi:hypothetical protein